MAHAICERCMLVKRYPLKPQDTPYLFDRFLKHVLSIPVLYVHKNCAQQIFLLNHMMWILKSICDCIAQWAWRLPLSCYFAWKVLYHTYSNSVGRLLSALPNVCYYTTWCGKLLQSSQSVAHSIQSHIIFFCWLDTLLSRNLDNMAKATTSLASAYIMDTLLSGDSLL